MNGYQWEGKDYSDLKSCIKALLHVATKLEKEMTVEELFFESVIFPNTIMSIEKLYNQACMIKANNGRREPDACVTDSFKQTFKLLAVACDMASTIIKFPDKRVSKDLKSKAIFVIEGFEHLSATMDM